MVDVDAGASLAPVAGFPGVLERERGEGFPVTDTRPLLEVRASGHSTRSGRGVQPGRA